VVCQSTHLTRLVLNMALDTAIRNAPKILNGSTERYVIRIYLILDLTHPLAGQC